MLLMQMRKALKRIEAPFLGRAFKAAWRGALFIR